MFDTIYSTLLCEACCSGGSPFLLALSALATADVRACSRRQACLSVPSYPLMLWCCLDLL